MSARRLLGLFALAASLAPAGLGAQAWHDFRAARQTADLTSLEVEVRYGAGRVVVEASEVPFLYDARVRYDADRFRPVRAFTREDGRGRLRFALSPAGSHEGTHIRVDDWDVEFDLEDLSRAREEVGQLELRLDPAVPTDLKLGLGAAEARLELGGLSLTSLTLLTGASDAEVAFGAPNRTRMERLSLTSGAAEFRAEGLGNAAFDEFEFQGVIGDILLDFEGAWERDARARIRIAVGELTIRVPAELGVRVHRESLFASLEAEGFEEVDGAWVTPNWETAERRFEIDLSSGLGTVEIERT